MNPAVEEKTLTVIESEVRPSLRPLEEEAKEVAIVDQATYERCCEIARRAAETRKTITERMAPGKKAAHAAWREWCDLEKQLLDAVAGAETIAKQKIVAWDEECERKRQEEQRRLEEEARKRAEEEKLAAAVAAEQEGAAPEEVEAILEEPEIAAPVYAPPSYQRAQGLSRPRDNWKAQVTSLPALIKYVAAHPEFSHLLQPAMPQINALARAQKNMLNIPGVRAFNDKNIAIRGRR